MRFILLCAICTLLSACATEVVTPEEAPTPELSERLRGSPPVGWHQIYQFNNVSHRLVDFVPAGENNIDWTAKISFESFTDLVDINPEEMLIDVISKDSQKCNFVQHANLFSGVENNYPTSVRLYLCGESNITEKGEIKIVKAIQGKHYFYVIRIVSRIEPFSENMSNFSKDVIATWSTYLRGITLCDDEQSLHACS